MNLTQAFVWNVGTCCLMSKEKSETESLREDESTEAKNRVRVIHSSVEVAVMAMERRDHIVQRV